MRRIYLDNNATTPLDPKVLEAMLPFLQDYFGNPSSGHRFGEQARMGIETARARVALLLNCQPSRLIFTSGGSEANNTAIGSAIASNPDKKHIISSVVEHASVLTPLNLLRTKGYEIELLPVGPEGELDLKLLERAIRDDTVLVSLMAANNETGVIWPIDRIGDICRRRQVLFHCDAVQLVGKEALDLAETPVDYLSVAAHKMHGPKGCGALYAGRTAPITSLIQGAGQENGHRAGTENVAGIVGFGMACEILHDNLAAAHGDIKALRDELEQGISTAIDNVKINGGTQPRLVNTSNISFKDASSAAIIQEFDETGIAISAHSACHSGDMDPSHVLTAMQIDERYIHGTLRISLSRLTTRDDIRRFLGIIPDVIAKSRACTV